MSTPSDPGVSPSKIKPYPELQAEDVSPSPDVTEDAALDAVSSIVKKEELDCNAGHSNEIAVKSEKPENQIREWNDFRKYVNVVHKGEHGSGEKTEYQCSLCGKIMSHGNMMMHIESAHFRGFLIHTCPICQKTFEAKSLLNNHKQRDHN